MVRLEENKHFTQDKAIERLPLPKRVYIPLIQHLGKTCNPEVKSGDIVRLGQRIAGIEAHVYAPIHSSVSGKVVGIQDWPHPVIGRAKAIVIETDSLAQQEWADKPKSRQEVSGFAADKIRKMVFDAGIVGMGGASFPTHIKLSPPKPVDTLIINAAECEPYITCDLRLMVERAEGLLLGVELIARCLGVKDVYIGIEENKPEAIKKLSANDFGFKLRVLKSEYPQGAEKQLVKNILNKEIPRGKLPFDIGVVVQNVATAYAIYEAVYNDKPLYERVVTVSGSCLENPKNLQVRLGTVVRELIAFCGPLKEEPAKIIIGGPMMGIAQFTDEVVIIKSSGGVLLFNKEESRELREDSCIRCGSCVRRCPLGLMPCLINLASQKGLWGMAKDYGVLDCVECGVCSYVCPANRMLVQSMKRAKIEALK